MNRNQALEALLRGEKVVSYFGFEYKLTKHGIESEKDDEFEMLPMSEGSTYSLMPAPGNPHAVGSMEWARFEFERGRTVVSPSGYFYYPKRVKSWDEFLIRISDLTGFWTLESTQEESSQSSPKASEPSPAESSSTTPEPEQESACRE